MSTLPKILAILLALGVTAAVAATAGGVAEPPGPAGLSLLDEVNALQRPPLLAIDSGRVTRAVAQSAF